MINKPLNVFSPQQIEISLESIKNKKTHNQIHKEWILSVSHKDGNKLGKRKLNIILKKAFNG